MKDDLLAEIAGDFNIARFVSIDPAGQVRHVHLGQDLPREVASTWQFVVSALLVRAGSVNIRSFTRDRQQGNPFIYGVRDIDHARDLVSDLLERGYFCIVNETIDIHDGGVSGVIDGDLVEFSPNDTPRAVEKPGVCSLSFGMAEAILGSVYGLSGGLPHPAGRRIEFSLHPSPKGVRAERVIVWEVGPSQVSGDMRPEIAWPNNFSRFLGDKVFGLLIAWSIGLPVPRTLVVPRNTAPFVFGEPTGNGTNWLRTAPTESRPGLFTTVSGWTDPFALLASEDPEGREIASVLYQDGVAAVFSGSTYPDDGRERVEGVRGEGDRFMLGTASPERIDSSVVESVQSVLRYAQAELGVRVRVEWVQDAAKVWVVQMHCVTFHGDAHVLEPGDRDTWLTFDPDDGLERLRVTLDRAKAINAGIELTKRVGLTSHVGDLLRRGGVPARFTS